MAITISKNLLQYIILKKLYSSCRQKNFKYKDKYVVKAA